MPLSHEQQKHIEAWQASGLTQIGYCREHGLNVKNFGRWLRNYRDSQIADVPYMLPVKIKPASLTPAIQLHCPQGHVVELPASISPQWLGEFVKCLD